MKKDLGLILIGVCFGIFFCSVGMFLVVANSGKTFNTPTPSPTVTSTYVLTRTITPTSTIIPFPIFSELETETYTPTPTKVHYATLVPTIKIIPTKKSVSQQTSQTYPAGVTAVCKDGTYSYSHTTSGTCSHHGGVKKWINKP